MITKERLEELIEQEATIYTFDINKNVYTLDLRDYKDLRFECLNEYSLSGLYENKEDAEFVAKYHTKRPVYFNPPLYSETKNIFYNFLIPNNQDVAYGKICVFKSAVFLEWFVEGVESCSECLGKTTKENYIKAVEKARKLFLGESDESNND